MKSKPTRLTRQSFVSMGAVLVLGLSLGMGWMLWVQAGDAKGAQADDVKARARLIADFTSTLQPGVLHGFSLGLASVTRGFVVEVSPLDPSDNGAHVVAFVQPEFDGSNWNDVVRVQLLAASAAVNANIRVYALVPRGGHGLDSDQ